MSASYAPPSVTAVKADTWIVPDIDAFPNNEWGKTVRFGRKLTVATYADLGPEVADPAKRFAGSNISCQSCDLEAGTKKFGIPFVGSSPIFRSIAHAKAKSARWKSGSTAA
jgi:thiosulfate dehydrogenase